VLRFAADENFNGDILRGVLRSLPSFDVVRVQDAQEVAGAPDPDVLQWAAQEGRVLITHDVSTLVGFAYERVESRLNMPGVMVVSDELGIGEAVDLILLVVGATDETDWDGQVRYLPL
jgi:hypothetical protein